MRFLLSVIDSRSNSADGNEMAAIDAFNDKLEANGHWILAAGIAGPETAVTVDNRDDAGQVTQAPFVDTHEYQSGFWLIKAYSLEQAVHLASEGSKACNRKVEVRAFL